MGCTLAAASSKHELDTIKKVAVNFIFHGVEEPEFVCEVETENLR